MDRINEHFVLDTEAARAALQRHAIPQIEGVVLCTNGIINSNYLVRTVAGNFLWRLYSSRTAANEPRDPAATEFEVSILERLAVRGFISQRPVRNLDGHLVSQYADRTFVLLTFIEGDVLPREAIDVNICEQIAGRLAEMQQHLDGFVPTGHKPDADYPLVRRLAASSLARLGNLGAAAEDLTGRVSRDWRELEARFSRPSLPTGIVHADIYHQNVIVRGKDVVGLIDFDDAYYGVQLYDLALLTMEFAIKKEGAMDFDLVAASLKGYLRQRRLSHSESSALYDAMRFLCFKFLGYTADLEDFVGDKVLENPYLQRLEMFRRPEIRTAFAEILSVTMAESL